VWSFICVPFQLVYQTLEWTGQIVIEAEPANLSLALFETTKDGEKQTMVNWLYSLFVCLFVCLFLFVHQSTSRNRNTVLQAKYNLKRVKQLCGLNGQHTCSQNVTHYSRHSEYKILRI